MIHTGDVVTALMMTLRRNKHEEKNQGGQSRQPDSSPRLSDKELIHCYFVVLGVSLLPVRALSEARPIPCLVLGSFIDFLRWHFWSFEYLSKYFATLLIVL